MDAAAERGTSWITRSAAAFPASRRIAYQQPAAMQPSTPDRGGVRVGQWPGHRPIVLGALPPSGGPEARPPGERERSRGARRALRAGAPERVARARGSLPDLTVPVAKAAALAEFHEGMYAGSSRHSMAFKWKTILRAFADWGTEPYPPSIGKVHWLGATLKAGGYRSAAGYLSLYRSNCARARDNVWVQPPRVRLPSGSGRPGGARHRAVQGFWSRSFE